MWLRDLKTKIKIETETDIILKYQMWTDYRIY